MPWQIVGANTVAAIAAYLASNKKDFLSLDFFFFFLKAAVKTTQETVLVKSQ